MTSIVGVLNSRGIAIAADSALTVTGDTVKRLNNRGHKIFKLSNVHPVGISVYGSTDFMGIPLDTIVKMYCNKIKDIPFGRLGEYKESFISFMKDQMKHVSREMQGKLFRDFCSDTCKEVTQNIVDTLSSRSKDISKLKGDAAKEIFRSVLTAELNEYYNCVTGAEREMRYVNVTIDEFVAFYRDELDDFIRNMQCDIQKKFKLVELEQIHHKYLIAILYDLINTEDIFEVYSGLIFFGFGDDEIYASTEHVMIGTAINGITRIKDCGAVRIVPGKVDSNVVSFAEGNVANTFLTGIDPVFRAELKQRIRNSFGGAVKEVVATVKNKAKADSITKILDRTCEDLLWDLDNYQSATIINPTLRNLAHMEIEDMAELAESLVNITSLKSKLTSSDESVGGPVDVAIVTKGDGFVWMKRKHYFDSEIND